VQEQHPRPDGAAASSDEIGVGRSSRHFADVNLAVFTIRAVAHGPQPRKHSLPLDTLQELLEEARLPRYCETIRAKGYASAIDLAEASSEELDELVQVLQLRPPEARRLRRSVENLARHQQ